MKLLNSDFRKHTTFSKHTTARAASGGASADGAVEKKSIGRSVAGLSYSDTGMIAPQVSVLGREEVARQVGRLALRYGIPVIADRGLTAKLGELKEGGQIPSSLYEHVAKLFVSLGLYR